MIVIKATLREETRRLTFDSHGFPPYEEVQEKVSGVGWQTGASDSLRPLPWVATGCGVVCPPAVAHHISSSICSRRSYV